MTEKQASSEIAQSRERLTLEERIVAEYNKTDLSARLVGAFALKMVRMELEAAGEIADKWYNAGTQDELNRYELPSEAIRKLAE